MNSSIKIDFRPGTCKASGLEPVIAVKLVDSDDPRDKLLKAFFESLGGDSSWLKVSFDGIVSKVHDGASHEHRPVKLITITTVTPDQMIEERDLMTARIEGSPHIKQR